MSDKQIELVKSFFDENAEEYRGKYEKKDPFYTYFFYQRLKKATESIQFENKTIFDIGAGSGALYDHIKKQNVNFNYYASDISEGILASGNIPETNYYAGNCYENNFGVKQFDYIFMLGVTTYIDPDELKKILAFIKSGLDKNGKLIITFTNKDSIDNSIRFTIRKLLKPFIRKNKMLSGDYKIYDYNKNEIEALLKNDFNIEEIKYLNQTIFPLSKIFKKLSIKLADRFEKSTNKKFLNKVSSDYLYFISLNRE